MACAIGEIISLDILSASYLLVYHIVEVGRCAVGARLTSAIAVVALHAELVRTIWQAADGLCHGYGLEVVELTHAVVVCVTVAADSVASTHVVIVGLGGA